MREVAIEAADPSAEDLPTRTADFSVEGCHTLPFPLCMNTDESSLGRCPDCGERIPEPWLLIEYESNDGETGIWAECPGCEDVVGPE